MWCRQCQQDVPGKPDDGKYACPRCGEELPRNVGRSGAASQSEPVFIPVTDPPPAYDEWDLEEQLRHIERVLRLNESEAQRQEPEDSDRWARVDPAHGQSPAWHVRPVKKRTANRSKERKKKTAALSQGPDRPTGSRASVLTWSILSLGSMGLACGGVLMGWSVVAGRPDLWSVGTPIVLVAQLVLLIGFIVQLDRLGDDNRSTSDKLEHFDQRLDELNTTTSLLGTSHTSPAASFYSHMAGGANPQLLLADLKSQLDLLALKISRVDR